MGIISRTAIVVPMALRNVIYEPLFLMLLKNHQSGSPYLLEYSIVDSDQSVQEHLPSPIREPAFPSLQPPRFCSQKKSSRSLRSSISVMNALPSTSAMNQRHRKSVSNRGFTGASALTVRQCIVPIALVTMLFFLWRFTGLFI